MALSELHAIIAIEEERRKFRVLAEGRPIWIVVAVHKGLKYLKTETDGYSPDNLLALPECL